MGCFTSVFNHSVYFPKFTVYCGIGSQTRRKQREKCLESLTQITVFLLCAADAGTDTPAGLSAIEIQPMLVLMLGGSGALI